jgi:hypothetical protein
MKMRFKLLFASLLLGISIFSCQNDESSPQYPYEAEVIGLNSDCGEYAIKILKGLSEVKSIVGSTFGDSIYIAKNLPKELQTDGLNIILAIRVPESNELGLCFNMGPTYTWLYIIRATKK